MNFRELKSLVNTYLGETEIFEVKLNNDDPERIGRYISGLSNSAAVQSVPEAFLIWGVQDESKELRGTNFYPEAAKVGNENLVAWLERNISKTIRFKFESVNDEAGLHFEVLIIEAAKQGPTKFKGAAYIRSGSSLKNLNEFPRKEAKLWNKLNNQRFELDIALKADSEIELEKLLSFETYSELVGLPPEASFEVLLTHLEASRVIKHSFGGYEITNLGALTLANKLSDFPSVAHKAVRVLKYSGRNKLDVTNDYTGVKGYAVGFEGLLNYVNEQIPRVEAIRLNGQRKFVTDFGQLELRELIANALVHQDLSIIGSRPTIEIYKDRVEISNPGEPVIDVRRFLDMPPRSRNEELANLFHQFGYVEERGSGIDKVVSAVEEKGLPAPDIETKGDAVAVTLFSRKPFKEMSDEEKERALYYHASLKYTERDFLTNASLRARFDLSERSSPQISKAIKLAVQAELIKPFDPEAGPKFMKYVPFWA